MKERRPHSLKSDIIVGVGGLALAVGAAVVSVKDEFMPSGNRPAAGICTINKVEGKANCTSGTPLVCRKWAMDILKSNDESFEDKIPSGCEGVGTIVIYKYWE